MYRNYLRMQNVMDISKKLKYIKKRQKKQKNRKIISHKDH